MATLKTINISDIVPGNNPRTNFPHAEHEELVSSIREVGLIQNIVVIELGNGKYEIVAGERRWRALKELAETDKSFAETECNVLPAGSEAKAAFMRLAENSVRLNLSAIEEAREFQTLCNTFPDMTQGEVAKLAGLKDSKASKRLSLLKLPAKTQEYIEQRKLDESTAYEICALCGRCEDNEKAKAKEAKQIQKFADIVVKDALGQREVHARIKRIIKGKQPKQSKNEALKGNTRGVGICPF